MIETHDLDHPEACGLVNVSSDSYPIRTVTIGKYYERNKIGTALQKLVYPGSTLYAKAYLSLYLGLLQYIVQAAGNC